MNPRAEETRSPRGTHRVWGRALRLAVDSALVGGIPVEPLFEGLPFDALTVRQVQDCDWEDYCVIVERIEARVGGPAACQALLQNAYHQVVPEARNLVGILVSPSALFHFLASINPVLFPCIDSKIEQLGERRFRWTLNLRPGARPCLAWFNGTVGTVRGMPGHLGLPPAEVTAELDPHRGVYTALFPESTARRLSLKAVTRSILGRLIVNLGYAEDGLGPGVVVGSIGALQSHLFGDTAARIEAVAERWELTAQQGKVLTHLVRGKSNKEVAAALGCAENTVELHVTNLFRKTGATSRTQLVSLFWSAL